MSHSAKSPPATQLRISCPKAPPNGIPEPFQVGPSAHLNLIKGSASQPLARQPGDPESHGPGVERSFKPLPLAHAFYDLWPECQVDFLALTLNFMAFVTLNQSLNAI